MFDPLRSYRERAGLGFGAVDLDSVRERRGHFVALGIVLVGLGALAILLPVAAALVTTLVIGWLLVVGGIAEGVHALVDRRWGGSGWALVEALFYIGAGVLVIAFPVAAKLTVTLVLTVFLIGDGVIKIVRATRHRALPGGRWLLWDGALSALLGVLLWLRWPASAVWVFGLWVGLSMVFNGTSMLVLGLGAGRAARARP